MNISRLVFLICVFALPLQSYATKIEYNGYYRDTDFNSKIVIGNGAQFRQFSEAGINSFLNNAEYQSLRDQGWRIASRTQIDDIYSSFGMTLNERLVGGAGTVPKGIGVVDLSVTNMPDNYKAFIKLFGDTRYESELEIGTFMEFVEGSIAYQMRVLIEETVDSWDDRTFLNCQSTLHIFMMGALGSHDFSRTGEDSVVLLTRDMAHVPEPSTFLLILSGIFAITIRKLKFKKV